MSIITLISDWGDTDYYAAAVKGAILSRTPGAVIVDISHGIPHFDISRTAYVLKNAFKSFPEGTIHLICVDSEETDKDVHVVVKYRGHYFIGLNNGIFSLLFEDEPEEVVTLEILFENTESTTFPCRDRFARAATMIAAGEPLTNLGKPHEKLKEKMQFKPTAGKSEIQGMVIHVDAYENLITNISRKLFNKVIGKNPFKISFRGHTIKKITEAYSDESPAEIVCLFNSNGYLEIALNKAEAASLLNIARHEKVTISIDEEQQPTLF